jgi:hypothetical protein
MADLNSPLPEGKGTVTSTSKGTPPGDVPGAASSGRQTLLHGIPWEPVVAEVPPGRPATPILCSRLAGSRHFSISILFHLFHLFHLFSIITNCIYYNNYFQL